MFIGQLEITTTEIWETLPIVIGGLVIILLYALKRDLRVIPPKFSPFSFNKYQGFRMWIVFLLILGGIVRQKLLPLWQAKNFAEFKENLLGTFLAFMLGGLGFLLYWGIVLMRFKKFKSQCSISEKIIIKSIKEKVGFWRLDADLTLNKKGKEFTVRLPLKKIKNLKIDEEIEILASPLNEEVFILNF